MDWNNFLNESAKRRLPQPIREAAEFIFRTDVLNMTGGIPNPLLFPFETASFRLSDGSCIDLSPGEMEKALQYNVSSGVPELVKDLTKLLKKYHNPPNMEKRGVCVTNGGQEGISKCLDLIVSRGDSVLVSKYIFTGVISSLAPYDPIYLAIEEDENGMIPQSLRDVLYGWINERNKPPPKVLYTIPNGCNPTGSTITGERRKEIYKIAQEYDFVIIEDDAYFFLTFEESEPSFLSLDTDGRVIHVDTFSKTISPGLRIGYVCAPREVIYRLNAFMQNTVQQVSTFTQMLLHKLLISWGEEGFDNQIKRVRNFYKNQRDCTMVAARKWLNGLAEWNVPSGGMFVWVKVLGISNTDRLCKNALKNYNVGILSGKIFNTETTDSDRIRISFSSLTPQEMYKAFEKLAAAIRDEKSKAENN